MNGFYTSEKLKRIEKKEQTESILREKVKRKHFGDDANPNNQSHNPSDSTDQDHDMEDEENGGYETKKAQIKVRSR